MDLQLVEYGNGGELVKNAKDLSVIYGFQNMPYLALFGGNVKANTPNRRALNEQAFDFWGNSLLMPNNQSIQFNSNTERILHEVALTSSGRIQIEQAVKKDLQFLSSFAKVSAAVEIIATDKIRIGVKVQEPDNLEEKIFLFIWDAAKKELVDKVFGGGVVAPTDEEGIFDMTFDITFN